jgi:hypothetical protein
MSLQAYSNFMVGGKPTAALKVLIALCENAPNDDALRLFGAQMVEPLLDLHWKQIGDAFEAEAKRKPTLRKALSHAYLHLKGNAGRDLERRLRSLVESRGDAGYDHG